MKKLIISLPKYKFANHVLVNGENVTFKKNKKEKLFTAEYETDDNQVTVSFDEYNPLLKWSWWLLGVIFYLITFFGLLDLHESHKFIYKYQAIVTLCDDGDNFLDLKPLRGKGPVVKAEYDCGGYEELVNEKVRDKKVKRRSTLLTLTKIFILLIGIAFLVFLAFMVLAAFLKSLDH